MNIEIMKELNKFDDEIVEAMGRLANAKVPSTKGNMKDVVDGMFGAAQVLSLRHQHALCAAVAAILEIAKETDANISVLDCTLREYVEESINSFANECRRNMREFLEEQGLPDIFDPNAKVRKEILKSVN